MNWMRLRAFRGSRRWQAFHRFNESGCARWRALLGKDSPSAIRIAKRLPVGRIKLGVIFARKYSFGD